MHTPGERIPVPGTYNFRDVGGYAVPGGTVRGRKLFRSDALSRVGSEGKQLLTELGVRTVVDLRDDDEVEHFPDDLAGLDIELVRLPVFEGSGRSQALADATLRGLYEAIALNHRDVLVAALSKIADTGDDAVVVHCTAGKDRTGIVIALALIVAGVDRQTVVEDYALTQSHLEGEWAQKMSSYAEKNGLDVTPRLREIMVGSPPAAMVALLDLIDERFGSVLEYLTSAGMGEGEIAQLRRSLVVYD